MKESSNRTTKIRKRDDDGCRKKYYRFMLTKKFLQLLASLFIIQQCFLFKYSLLIFVNSFCLHHQNGNRNKILRQTTIYFSKTINVLYDRSCNQCCGCSIIDKQLQNRMLLLPFHNTKHVLPVDDNNRHDYRNTDLCSTALNHDDDNNIDTGEDIVIQDNHHDQQTCNKTEDVSFPTDHDSINNTVAVTTTTSKVTAKTTTTTTATTTTAPTLRIIFQFAIPAIGIWLCNPLLSMIDTATVGLYAGTAHQAALNPATAITDYATRSLSFLYTGITNLVAIAQVHDDDYDEQNNNNNNNTNGSNKHDETARRFFGALQLSTIVGAILGLLLFIFTEPMLHILIGNQSLDPNVSIAAIQYVRIRSLGMPAAAMIGTMQAACLGMKDVTSPFYLIIISSTINFITDLILVRQPNIHIGGAAGAAWATIFSQYVAISLFINHLMTGKKYSNNGKQQSISMSVTWNNNKHDNNKIKSFIKSCHRMISMLSSPSSSSSTKGILANTITIKKFCTKWDIETMKAFIPYFVPVTTTQIGRNSVYIAMGHVVSSSLGTISMAANQIVTSIFYALIPIGDSLSLTAQSLLPGIIAKEPSIEKSKTITTAIFNLLKAAGIFGLFLTSIVACIPFGYNAFTTDTTVIHLVQQIIPVLMIIFSLHGVFCGAEGILLANRDLSFLGRMYTIYFIVVPFLMLKIKSLAKAGVSVDLTNVWFLFLKYQLVRTAIWVVRVWILQRRHNEDATSLG